MPIIGLLAEPGEERLRAGDLEQRAVLGQRGAVHLTGGEPRGDRQVAQDARDDLAGDEPAEAVRRRSGQQRGGGGDPGVDGGAHAIPFGAW